VRSRWSNSWPGAVKRGRFARATEDTEQRWLRRDSRPRCAPAVSRTRSDEGPTSIHPNSPPHFLPGSFTTELRDRSRTRGGSRSNPHFHGRRGVPNPP